MWITCYGLRVHLISARLNTYAAVCCTALPTIVITTNEGISARRKVFVSSRHVYLYISVEWEQRERRESKIPRAAGATGCMLGF